MLLRRALWQWSSHQAKHLSVLVPRAKKKAIIHTSTYDCIRIGGHEGLLFTSNMALHLRDDFRCNTCAAHTGGMLLQAEGVVLLFFALYFPEHQDLVEDRFRFQTCIFVSVFVYAARPLTLRLEDATRDAGFVIRDPGMRRDKRKKFISFVQRFMFWSIARHFEMMILFIKKDIILYESYKDMLQKWHLARMNV